MIRVEPPAQLVALLERLQAAINAADNAGSTEWLRGRAAAKHLEFEIAPLLEGLDLQAITDAIAASAIDAYLTAPEQRRWRILPIDSGMPVPPGQTAQMTVRPQSGAVKIFRMGVTHYVDAKDPAVRFEAEAAEMWRVDIDPANAPGMLELMNDGTRDPIGWFSSCMVELTHRGPALAYFELEVADEQMMMQSGAAIQKVCGITYQGSERRTHVVGRIRFPGGKNRVLHLHMQPPRDAGDHAITPFQHLLIGASSDLKDADFWALDRRAGTPAITMEQLDAVEPS